MLVYFLDQQPLTASSSLQSETLAWMLVSKWLGVSDLWLPEWLVTRQEEPRQRKLRLLRKGKKSTPRSQEGSTAESSHRSANPHTRPPLSLS